MSRSAKTKRKKTVAVLDMDGDKIGLTVAALCATVVMALCFQAGVEGFTVAFRVCVTFLAVYVIVWALVKYIHHTHISDRRQVASAASKEESAREAEGES